MKRTLAALRNGIDNVLRIIEQTGLQDARRLTLRWSRNKAETAGTMANLLRRILRQQFAFMQNKDLCAPLGFIQVSCRYKHGQLLILNHLLDDFPQFAAR